MIRVTIDDVEVSVIEKSVQVKQTIDGRSTCQFTVRDLTGLNHYQDGQPVTLVDSRMGTVFTGYVYDCEETNLYPSTTILSAITCVDAEYLPGKRYYSGLEYKNRFAGDIVTDLLGTVLSAEGITASYASASYQTASEWQLGSLNNVVGTNNVSGGDLELTPAGAAVEIIESGSDFTTGTPGNTQVINGALTQKPFSAIKIDAIQSLNNAGNTYSYVKIANDNTTVMKASYFFEYEMFVVASSPEIKIALDLVFTDGTTLRDKYAFADSQNMSPHPNTDLSGLADGKWYSRSFSLGNFSGKTVSYVSIGVEGDKSGEYRAYFKSIRITDNTFTKWYFNNTASLSAIQQMQNYGYSSTVVRVVPCYNPIDDRIGPPIRLDACKISARTYVAWTSVLSNNSKSGVGYSLDHGNSWIACHNNAPLPYFPAGLSVSGQSIMFRQLLASGDTPEDAASIKQFEFTCLPGYNGTKTDLFKYVVNGSDWAAGTFTNTNNSFDPHTLKLSGATTRFDTIPSTTNFGSSGSGPYINNKTLALQVNGIGDLRVRCDFAGKYQNFLAEVDIQVSAHYSIGLVYRGTNWGMSLDSYAYSVTVGLTSILLARGSNSTGAGNFTSVQNVTGLALPEGSWHRLKLIVNGTSHKAYLNEVLMINSTDSTYNFAGHVGLRVYNPTASTTFTGYVNNFGVVPSLSGTWLSPTLDLTPLGTYESSVLYYGDVSGDLAGNPSDCTVLFEYTKDFGSTWTDVPLGGGLSLTPGASTIGMTLQFRFTLSTTSATTLAGVNAVVLKILGGFGSRGYRIGPALSLSSVGRAGNTLVYWSGVQAAGTSIALDTSIDGGGIWSQIGTGAQGAAQIAGITTQADPTIDDFGTDTSHSYTSTSLSTGDPATWITANNSLIASGGKNALYIYNTPSIGADGDVQVIMDQATASGLVWRYAGDNYYEMVVHDASSSNNPNTIQLFKAVSGTTIQIGSTISISFTRGTPHVFRANMVGSAITIYMDGNSLLSTTDTTISVAGYCGLSNSGSSARYYMLRIQTYGDDLTGKQVYTRVRLESTSPIVTPQLQNLSISVHNANIQNGVLIPGPTNYSVLNGHKKTIAQIFDDLCKQSGNYWWRIVAGQLYFQSYQAIPAPFVITNKDVLVANAKVMNGNAVYRNAQWMTGVKDIVRLPPQRFLGNGVNQTFTLPFPVSSINSITVNGVESRVGIKNADVGKDWYYKQGDPQIVQDAAAMPLNDTQMLSIECEVEVDITIHVKRDAEIANRAAIDRSSGIIEEVEAAPSGATKASMIVKADGLLTQCAVAGKTATFTTRRSGLAVGQLISMFVSPFVMFDGVFLITEVDMTWQTESHNGVKVLQPTFGIVAVQGPIIGDWTRFIDNLAGG